LGLYYFLRLISSRSKTRSLDLLAEVKPEKLERAASR
jgi:hypothetical protein